MREAERPEGPVRIAPATREDIADWLAMRLALWPDSADEHEAEIEALLARPEDTITLIARGPEGVAQGFAEAAIRHDYVNGCDTSPVAFVEGIFVMPETRGHGVGRALMAAIARWGRENNCTELASDTLLDNTASQAMHKALGFVETERVVFFRKNLT